MGILFLENTACLIINVCFYFSYNSKRLSFTILSIFIYLYSFSGIKIDI